MSTANSQNVPAIQGPTLFGHPTGLFTLFFAEMWERFSYYGMRALLTLYMIKGFLGLNDNKSYEIYGIYTALVYATPFIGGMLADKILGARKAVIVGGVCFAAGHLIMTIENEIAFFTALALIIVGNGFFKPNISTMVGSLYPEGCPQKSSGFTLFYMGINLGAAMSPLLCGYIGETYGWHYGFGLATIGMLIGLAVFVAPVRVTQILILLGALGAGAGMLLTSDNSYLLGVNILVLIALLAAVAIAFVALNRGGLPKDVGRLTPETEQKAKKHHWKVYAGVLLVVPALAVLMSCSAVSIPIGFLPEGLRGALGLGETFTLQLAGATLTIFGAIAFGYLIIEAVKSPKIERHRLFVVLILMFFSMLFWAFSEQAGSSVNNFTDRNVDRVIGGQVITAEQAGTTIHVTENQEQLGYRDSVGPLTLDRLDKLREDKQLGRDWQLDESHVGMTVGGDEVPASVYQAANPIYILTFGLLFTALWAFLAKRGLEPSTSVKFAIGLLLLGLGFGAFWYGAQAADARGMVWMGWLLIGYLLQTTGELCLSPVGLSMVTSLSPARMVSTVMGAWFLATAFSNYLAGLIAMLTGVSGDGDEAAKIPVPSDTVAVYGDVFLKIALAALISGVFLLIISPLITRWMHLDEPKVAESK